MVDLCTLSGILKRPDGSPYDDADLEMFPDPRAPVAVGSTVSAPVRTVFRTGADGSVQITLRPGRYKGSGVARAERFSFDLGVPNQVTGALEQWLGQDVQVLTSAEQARDAAAASAAAAAASVAALKTAAFLTWAEAISAVTGLTGTAAFISVRQGREVSFFVPFVSGTPALTTGDGRQWQPAGAPSVYHYGPIGLGDDTAAFTAANAQVIQIRVPRGAYALTTSVAGRWLFEPGITMTGAGVLTVVSVTVNRVGVVATDYTRGLTAMLRPTGSITAPVGFVSHHLIAADDNTKCQALVDGLSVVHTIRAGVTGARTAFAARMQVVGPREDVPGLYVSDVADSAIAYSTANQNGTGVYSGGAIDDGYKGGLFAGNDNAWLAPGATFYRSLIGREINVSIFPGGSAFASLGLFIVQKTTEQAVADQSAICVAGAGPDWKHGVAFGATWGDWCFRPTATLIGAQRRQYPTVLVGAMDAAYGVDFREVTFSGAAFASPGFAVDGDGDVTLKSALLAAGSVSLPALGFAADTNTGLFNPAADQIGLATGGVQRALLSSTALQIDVPVTGTAVTQTAIDTTAGRLLKVSDFGLGGQTGDVSANASALPTRFARFDAGAGTPDSARWHGLHLSRASDAQSAQIAVNETGAPVLATRNRGPGAPGTWNAWNVLYGRTNILGTVTQAAGIPTGALIETGSNANGFYTRFANGLLICRHALTASAGAAVTWTYPSAFSAAPDVFGAARATVLSGFQLDAAPGTTTATFSARDKTDARRADPCELLAVGRWF